MYNLHKIAVEIVMTISNFINFLTVFKISRRYYEYTQRPAVWRFDRRSADDIRCMWRASSDAANRKPRWA